MEVLSGQSASPEGGGFICLSSEVGCQGDLKEKGRTNVSGYKQVDSKCQVLETRW